MGERLLPSADRVPSGSGSISQAHLQGQRSSFYTGHRQLELRVERCVDPTAFERAHNIRTLRSYQEPVRN